MSSSVQVNNKKNDILFLGVVLTQGLNNTTLTAEAKDSFNFTQWNRTFCLCLDYNRSKSFYLLMLQKHINSKQTILKKQNISCV